MWGVSSPASFATDMQLTILRANETANRFHTETQRAFLVVIVRRDAALIGCCVSLRSAMESVREGQFFASLYDL
ncbi:hypothetical protein FHX57_006561 [Paraburkholderia tropica]|uniref:Uncharacterized protein n=1 Tax=Paraburkholderia tropica TaxID=92647 RepID=A0AAQ1JSN3_9BURK|nr:hypothetical protein [Paraburkholderia tropica]MBB3004182.1 hypothetical protein [Paraburkholderia tropica]MBB6323151.1 hypothetical protein [Paraburkholderia tropica]PXX03321.1 hypothetical protein C7400_1505 [Paraburkholderia tropica]PZW69348.1 hypothetical protein C7399_1505 [Paraburkholderia tropica]